MHNFLFWGSYLMINFGLGWYPTLDGINIYGGVLLRIHRERKTGSGEIGQLVVTVVVLVFVVVTI